MRKRKQTPLGPARVRSVPSTSPDPVQDRRPLIPLEPGLVEVASGLLPAASSSEPAAWTSWALQDQPGSEGFSYWETPIVDGDLCHGGGVGFPDRPADSAPITIDDVTSAAAAGWPHPTGAPGPARSWVAAIGSLGLGADAPATTPVPEPLPDTTFSDLPRFEPSGVADSMALHPSARQAPAPEADVVAVPQPGNDTSFDAVDFVARFERGASIALTESHLHALAARALDRLVPRSAGTWFSEQPGDRLAVAFSHGTAGPGGCGVVDRRSCPAIVDGATQRFDRPDELDVCPHLLAMAGGTCAAVCTPVHARGPLRGVLFLGRPAAIPLDDAAVPLIEHVAATIARRVAEVRDAVGSTGTTPAE